MKALTITTATSANFSFDPVPCHEFRVPVKMIRQVTVYDYDDHSTEVRICDERFDVYGIVRFSTGCVFIAYERPA